ncbi:MAG TPA: VCBS repeat-containing protein [Vicinamibacterales bacterium]
MRAVLILAAAVTLTLALVVGGVWWLVSRPSPSTSPSSDQVRAAVGQRWSTFASRSLGHPPQGDERPQITHVAIADIDGDGLGDVLVCDGLRNVVAWIRQGPRGVFTEQALATVVAPAHAEAVDFDKDGDTDVLVGALGFLFPNNNRVGSVLLLENDGLQRFTPRTLVADVARVADARAADLDGDGDLDVSVAGFGYDDGETSWLENRGDWRFEQHVLQRLSGGINAVPSDVSGDGKLDIVTLVSQEWEEIWAFVNDGAGAFTPRMIWGSTNPDFGSSWLSMVDLDRDGDPDILYANGDAFEYAPPNSRPWQGIQWLENKGSLSFELHRMVDLQGATSPEAVDLDGDGDLDVLLVTANNDWDDPKAPSLLWLENDGVMRFTLHGIASAPTHLQSVAVGDLDGDGKPDAATGGMHINRPYDRLGRVMGWFSEASPR